MRFIWLFYHILIVCASVFFIKIMEIINSFAKNLKILRESHNLSMTELAELLFIKTSAGINQFESGRSNPSLETAISIATLFGVSLEWLTGMANEPYTVASIAAANVAKSERLQRVDPDDNISTMILKLSRDARIKPQILLKEPSLALQANYIFLLNATFLNDLEHLQRQKGTPSERLATLSEDKKPGGRLEKRKAERYKLFLEAHNGFFVEPIFPLTGTENK